MATDDWSLVIEGWDPADEGRREAILTLGNGRFATRGAAPESRADGVHYPGTYAAGCFNRLRDDISGQTVESESMVNMPNWLDLRFAVEDGHWFAMADVEIIQHRLTLDMRRGLLVRTLRFVDAVGRHTTVRQRRFVHMGDPYLAGLQTVVTAEDWTGTLRISSGIDGAVTNAGVARYGDLSARHLTVLARREPDPSSVLLVARTTQSQVRVAAAARTTAVGGAATTSRRLWQEPGRIGHELELPMRPGVAVTIDKVATLVTSRDVAISEPALTAVELLADASGFDDLLISHELAWRQLWRRFRLDLTDGIAHGATETVATDTLRTLRLSTFHVLQSVSLHAADLDAGIPARGLHGEAYRGHVFWDELFVFPMLTLRMPSLARALLQYRVRRLGAARRAARAAGHRGAMFPWQSGSDGREESQRAHLNPQSGHWLPDTSHLQRHVGLAVAYSIWQYYQATGDLEFLTDHGAEVSTSTRSSSCGGRTSAGG